MVEGRHTDVFGDVAAHDLAIAQRVAVNDEGDRLVRVNGSTRCDSMHAVELGLNSRRSTRRGPPPVCESCRAGRPGSCRAAEPAEHRWLVPTRGRRRCPARSCRAVNAACSSPPGPSRSPSGPRYPVRPEHRPSAHHRDRETTSGGIRSSLRGEVPMGRPNTCSREVDVLQDAHIS
jgi:hypothetical protein